MFSFYPRISRQKFKIGSKSGRPVANVLEEYFQRPVVLFSSGRGAISTYLEFLGYSSYQHTIAVPAKFCPSCVINAVSEYAFPLRVPSPADILLYYEQYGFTQRRPAVNIKKKYKLIIQDSAHSFFDQKRSDFPRILSFQKFFPVGFGGAIILNSEKEKEKLAAFLAGKARLDFKSEQMIQKMNFAYYSAAAPGPKLTADMAIAYAMVQCYPRPLASTLSLMPQKLSELVKIEKIRTEYFNYLRDSVVDMRAKKFIQGTENPPFIFPGLLTDDYRRRNRLIKKMNQIGLGAKTYHLDENRDELNSHYVPAVVIPCHQLIPWPIIKAAGMILKNF